MTSTIRAWQRRKYIFTDHTMQNRENEMNRATAALSWSSLLAILHSLLTSHDGQDKHS